MKCLPFVAALMILAAPADAADTLRGPWYFGLQGGASFLMDADNEGDGSTINIQSETDPGFAVGGFMGYRFPIGIRLEGELTYRRNGMDKLTITDDGGVGTALGVGSLNGMSAEADGHVSSLTFMANAWYEPQFGSWLPYIGGGVGGARVAADVDTLGVTIVDDSDFVLAGQAGGGIGYAFGESIVLSLDYRFLLTADPTFEDETGAEFDSEYMNHTMMVGLRGAF